MPELEEPQSDGIIAYSRQQHQPRGPRNEHHTRVDLPIRVILDECTLLTSSALRGVDRRLMYHNQGLTSNDEFDLFTSFALRRHEFDLFTSFALRRLMYHYQGLTSNVALSTYSNNIPGQLMANAIHLDEENTAGNDDCGPPPA
jgi:hypothetical protein